MNKVLLLCFLFAVTLTTHGQTFKLIENNRLAKIVGRMNRSEEKYALTFGNVVLLSCSRADFFAEDWWVRHEMTHVKQYKKFGIAGFLKRYALYSILHPYSKNPFEKEALSEEKQH